MPTSVLVEKFGDGYILRYVEPFNGSPMPTAEGARVTRELGDPYSYPTDSTFTAISLLRQMFKAKESPPPETETP